MSTLEETLRFQDRIQNQLDKQVKIEKKLNEQAKIEEKYNSIQKALNGGSRNQGIKMSDEDKEILHDLATRH